jgi:hypothetical protein
LKFSVGEVLYVTGKTDGRFWKGECNGAKGIFPSEYVREVPTETETVTVSDLVACLMQGDESTLDTYLDTLPKVFCF